MKLSCNNTIFVLLPVLVTSAHLRSKELSKVDFPGESGIEVNYDVSGEDLNVNEDAFLGGDNPQDEFWNKIEGEFQNNAEDTGYVGYDEKVEDIPADISSQEHISDYSFLQGVGTGFEGTMHSVLVNSSVIGDAGTETSEEIIELGSEATSVLVLSVTLNAVLLIQEALGNIKFSDIFASASGINATKRFGWVYTTLGGADDHWIADVVD
eukprot:CAMPEP_0178938214 /NCGR_PEP_ID=MMETSP0786-20121207/26206_1 /TAXON_ID=186022 /ORGANISM="Thalassionema frauenfeldii, Strain CCMP 1798" /LENGTH=209 /DNA_ID=CAMNT_0020616907 /DNA_START=56 /DNA_END=687 /DNA_ORIENTATION=-